MLLNALVGDIWWENEWVNLNNSIKGKQIHEALENSVSQYPKLEGRFPQVSGISFTFNPSKPSGKRVDINSIKIQNHSMILDQVMLLQISYILIR